MGLSFSGFFTTVFNCKTQLLNTGIPRVGAYAIPSVLHLQPVKPYQEQRARCDLLTAPSVTSQSTGILLRRPQARYWMDTQLFILSDDRNLQGQVSGHAESEVVHKA